jgi:hypothetical protein
MPVILAIQEDCGSKPAWANSSQDPDSKKKPHYKKWAGVMAQAVGTEFKPWYCKKKYKAKQSILPWPLECWIASVHHPTQQLLYCLGNNDPKKAYICMYRQIFLSYFQSVI